MTKRRLKAFLFFVLVGSLALTQDNWAAQTSEKLRVAYPTISMAMAPWWIAQEKGYFRQEGLDVESMYIRGDSTIVQALVGGDIQAGYAGATPVAAAIAQGVPLSIVAVPANRMGYLLVTREPVKDPRELQGKKFAVSSLGGSSEIATRLGLEKIGVDPSKVIMLQVGGSPDRIAAIKRGSVDGSLLSANEVIGGAGLGFYTIFDFTKSDLEYPYNVLYVRKQFAAESRNAVLGLLRGFMKGLWSMQDHQDEAIAIAARWLRNSDKEVLARQWKYIAFQFHQEIPAPTEAGFRLALNGMAGTNPKAASLQMRDIVDVSFVNELARDGFFKNRRS